MPVERVQVGERAGFDDVRAAAFAGHDPACEIDADTDFTDGVLALGHTADAVIHKAAFGAGNAIHRFEHGVNRAVACAGIVDRLGLAGLEQADGGGRNHAGGDAEIIQFPNLRHLGELAFDERADVVVVDGFLFVGERLDAFGDGFDFVVAELVAHCFQFLPDRVVAHVFAPREFAGATDFFGAHDFVGGPVLDHAVLVNAGLVGERVVADDGFVALHHHAGQVRDEPAGRINLTRIDAGRVTAKCVLAGLERHDGLFERGVAGALAEAVDRALDLPGAVHDGGQRVGDSEAEIVVAMHADDGFPDVFHVVEQIFDERTELMRRGVANGIRYVHSRRAGGDDGFSDLREKFRLSPRSVFRRELDIGDMAARAFHAFDGAPNDFALRHFEFEFPVNRARREKNVNPAPVAGRFDGFTSAVNVFIHAPGEAGNTRAGNFTGNGADSFEIAVAGNWEAGFDDVHFETGKLPGDFQLFAGVHGRAGALLAVAESGIKD